MGEGRWRRVTSEVFDEKDAENHELVTVTIDTKDKDLIRGMLEDPLELLTNHISGIDEGWTISYERLNAIDLRPPRKLICVWWAIHSERRAHGVFYRVPRESQGSQSS
jgi:hypothetical protein